MNFADIPSIGPTSTAWLREVGIESRSDLELAGPVAVFLSVHAAGYRPSLNLLWALAAGLRGKHWADLSASDMCQLRQELIDAEK